MTSSGAPPPQKQDIGPNLLQGPSPQRAVRVDPCSLLAPCPSPAGLILSANWY